MRSIQLFLLDNKLEVDSTLYINPQLATDETTHIGIKHTNVIPGVKNQSLEVEIQSKQLSKLQGKQLVYEHTFKPGDKPVLHKSKVAVAITSIDSVVSCPVHDTCDTKTSARISLKSIAANTMTNLEIEKNEDNMYNLKTKFDIHVNADSHCPTIDMCDIIKSIKTPILDQYNQLAREGRTHNTTQDSINWVSENHNRSRYDEDEEDDNNNILVKPIRTHSTILNYNIETLEIPSEMVYSLNITTIVKLGKNNTLGEVLESLNNVECTLRDLIFNNDTKLEFTTTINEIAISTKPKAITSENDHDKDVINDYHMFNRGMDIIKDATEVLSHTLKTHILHDSIHKAKSIVISVIASNPDNNDDSNRHRYRDDTTSTFKYPNLLMELCRLQIVYDTGEVTVKAIDKRMLAILVLSKAKLKPYIRIYE